jgi:hypothetical protein
VLLALLVSRDGPIFEGANQERGARSYDCWAPLGATAARRDRPDEENDIVNGEILENWGARPSWFHSET